MLSDSHVSEPKIIVGAEGKSFLRRGQAKVLLKTGALL
jgi:hypothetical protein